MTASLLDPDVLGLYGTFDSVIWLREMTTSRRANAVLRHEWTHFFQNYFTLVGESHYVIVRLINDSFEALLLNCRGTVGTPFLDWFREHGSQQANPEGFKYFDRVVRLFTQLGTAMESARFMARNRDVLSRVDMQSLFDARVLSIEPSTGFLTVNGQDFMPVDYASICESMALAYELLYGALETLQTAGVEEEQVHLYLEELLRASVGEVANDATKLNYTYPLLLLLQSGYNSAESVFLTIDLSFAALMQHWIAPGMPEFGTSAFHKFGAAMSKVYCSLLHAAINDRMLARMNSVEQMAAAGATAMDYLDGLCEDADVAGLRERSDAALNFFHFLRDEWSEKDGRDAWYTSVLDSVCEYHDVLRTAPLHDGMRLLHRPLEFLMSTKAFPAIVSPAGAVDLTGEDEDRFTEAMKTAARLHLNQCLLFGRHPGEDTLSRATDFHSYARDRMRSVFNLTVQGW